MLSYSLGRFITQTPVLYTVKHKNNEKSCERKRLSVLSLGIVNGMSVWIKNMDDQE